jgi:hypothetical protein
VPILVCLGSAFWDPPGCPDAVLELMVVYRCLPPVGPRLRLNSKYSVVDVQGRAFPAGRMPYGWGVHDDSDADSDRRG